MSTNEIQQEATAVEEQARESAHHAQHHEHHHHEHHHSHHHHRHHQKKRRRSLKDMLPKFMKKKKFWVNVSIIAAALVLLAAVAISANGYQKLETQRKHPQSFGPENYAAESRKISVSVPFFEEDVYLVGLAALDCLEADLEEPAEQVLATYREEDDHLDRGLPVRLSYEINDLPPAYSVKGTTVEISEDSQFRSPRVLTVKGQTQSVDVYHLKTGTQYYYRINIQLSNGAVAGAQGSFRTAETPRILHIEGAVNIRDIGGWKTVDGKTIRQGLLYRGGELDGAMEPTYSITSKGLEDMLLVLGIRTDLDLRASTDNPYGTDALGAGVEHIYYGIPAYEGIFSDWGKTQVRKIFAKLAQESTYPTYLHCTYGVDRTGTICYLLEAMLGVEERDLMREYRLSSLHHNWQLHEGMEQFTSELNTYPGATIQEKTEAYLLSAGVTEAEIETIKQIFLEE